MKLKMLKQHVFLVGMAGAGKTSLGRKLAQNLNIPFLDTDQLISDTMGISVNEIFSVYGEAVFRKAETGVLMWLANRKPFIVSTGGGLCAFRENIELMHNLGRVIHIDRPLEQILLDIKVDRRPLLAGGTRQDVIDQYNARIGFYRLASDYRLDNSKGFYTGIRELTDMVLKIED